MKPWRTSSRLVRERSQKIKTLFNWQSIIVIKYFTTYFSGHLRSRRARLIHLYGKHASLFFLIKITQAFWIPTLKQVKDSLQRNLIYCIRSGPWPLSGTLVTAVCHLQFAFMCIIITGLMKSFCSFMMQWIYLSSVVRFEQPQPF